MKVKAFDTLGHRAFIADSRDPNLSFDRPPWTEERKVHKAERIESLKSQMAHIDMEIQKIESDGEPLVRAKSFEWEGRTIFVTKSNLLLCLKLFRDELDIDYQEDSMLLEFDGAIPSDLEAKAQDLARETFDAWKRVLNEEEFTRLQRMVDTFFWETRELPIEGSTLGGKVQ